MIMRSPDHFWETLRGQIPGANHVKHKHRGGLVTRFECVDIDQVAGYDPEQPDVIALHRKRRREVGWVNESSGRPWFDLWEYGKDCSGNR
jgi:hypothetical protein